ncbi:MAG: dihydropteroate synthase [Polyangiales bacterium]
MSPRAISATSGPPQALAAWCGGRGVPARISRAVVVGVLNATPDSFSDGGRFVDGSSARAHVDRLLADGADVIEIGGESTRPAGPAYGSGFRAIDSTLQIERVSAPLTHATKERNAVVAVDTTDPTVARYALERGATIVNDVSCLKDPELARVVAAHDAWLVLMHSRPGASSSYVSILDDVMREWILARDRALEAGVRADRLVFDPGLGFGKDAAQSLALLRDVDRFHALGHALYVGASRKSFLAACEARAGLDQSAPPDRDAATITASLWAIDRGAAAVRVHDVRAMRQAMAVRLALQTGLENEEDRDA